MTAIDTTATTDTAATAPGTARRGRRRARTALALAATAVLGGIALASPASAVSQAQAGFCKTNYDLTPANYLLANRAPKVWSENGGAQSVRYRSVLDKWDGDSWNYQTASGWHYGTAYPNSAWQGPLHHWDIDNRGAGSYSSRTQVQYYASGAWGGTDTARINAYDWMTYYWGSWTHNGAVTYCQAYR